MNLSSKLLEEAVTAFSSLPGIGKKTALRLALHLLTQEEQDVKSFSDSLTKMRKHIRFCRQCFNISDSELCSICESHRRDRGLVCVVEGIKDVMAIESTGQYNGLYHVLGGVISPIEGISPSDLEINALMSRIDKGEIKEIIMAISPTIEGDTTIYYISKKLKNVDIKISTLARGISFGGELEYADELTLGRSIASRRPYGE
ncbi:MAG: recombination protein RecR [Saprospiraceae bacterium]